MTPTLIVTRPARQSEAFANAVAAQWDGPLDVIQSPLLEIKPVPIDVDLTNITGVIFTSANGVAATQAVELPKGLTAWCVGEKTAALAKDVGFRPIVGPGDAEGLVHVIIKDAPTGAFAHIRGRHARGQICTRLLRAGITCLDVIAYDQKAFQLNAEAQDALAGNDPVVFPLFSPRTGTILSREGPFLAPIHLVVMSNRVRDACNDLRSETVIVAAQPDEDAMVATTLRSLWGLTQGRG